MSRNVGGGRRLGSKNAVHVRLVATSRREPTVNAEELRRLSEAATPGPWKTWHGDDSYAMNCHGIVTGDCDDEYVDDDGHAQHTVALTLLQQPRYASHDAARWDDDAAFIVALENAYRSNQLQVIERDRLARALAEVEHAAGCNDPETVDWASRRGYEFGHPVTAHLPAMLRKADAIISALDSTTGDPE